MTKKVLTPLEDRLFARVDFSGPCWEWTGARSGPGYGLIGLGRRADGVNTTHRVMWELLVGPVPDGLELDHLCRVRHCCNPDHLEPVPRKVNANRGTRWSTAALSRCRRGHLFTPENTLQTKTQRHCRTCRRMRAKEKTAA